MSSTGRLLALSEFDGATNMSVDEAIVTAVAHSAAPPTLRFYAWSRPTLSLGYFQPISGASGWSDAPVDIVRRSTGGGAIMHHHELTYSLSLPVIETGPGARESVYREVHACVVGALRDFGVVSTAYRDTALANLQRQDSAGTRPAAMGLRADEKTAHEPFLCFQRRTDEDLICSGYKIMGSAQRRVRGGVLQHGSLLMRASAHANVLPGVTNLAAVEIDAGLISRLIADRVGRALSIDWEAGDLSDSELTTSERIRAERYAADAWTRRR